MYIIMCIEICGRLAAAKTTQYVSMKQIMLLYKNSNNVCECITLGWPYLIVKARCISSCVYRYVNIQLRHQQHILSQWNRSRCYIRAVMMYMWFCAHSVAYVNVHYKVSVKVCGTPTAHTTRFRYVPRLDHWFLPLTEPHTRISHIA